MQFNRRNFIAGAVAAGVASASAPNITAQCRQGDSTSQGDWMINPAPYVAKVIRHTGDKEIELTNGLVRRAFRLAPNVATIALDNLMTGESELRSVRSEAVLTINQQEIAVGGLHGQPFHNYFLPEWLSEMTADESAFHFVRIEEGKTVERFPWKRVDSWSTEKLPWPPPGVSLIFYYEPGPRTPIHDLNVQVHYELYDGIPLIGKWIEIENQGSTSIQLNSFKAEVLAIVESSVSKLPPGTPGELLDKIVPLHVETDYSFGGNMSAAQDNPAVHWGADPLYGEAYYEHKQPSLLECKPPIGPDLEIQSKQRWRSFTVFELLHDSSEEERRGLAMRRMMTTLAPWVQENPIYMHARHAEPEKVKAVVDQCADVGFEMVILSFGSGFNIENTDPKYLAEMKDLADYSRSKGVAIGGYSLLASRGGQPQDLVINKETGKPDGAKFGPSPCLGSKWAETYFQTLRAFFLQTGMSVFENDGSYPGDLCASTTHPGHKGYLDSQWQQWEIMSDFYRWCCAQGIYLTVPDWYFLNGQNKTGMGYTENDWSLPRQYQPLIERQDIYDGTWEKTPSMGWMHVPLMQYHGGGSAATVEPLQQNLTHYQMRLSDLFGAGVQAAWRGDRLYDTNETRDAVQKWVSFYKTHRAILNSDIIHLRRPDGRDWDGILHVNPQLKTRGLAVFYNPLNKPISRVIKLPLYYTGLTDTAKIAIEDATKTIYSMDREYAVRISIQIPALGCTWLTVD